MGLAPEIRCPTTCLFLIKEGESSNGANSYSDKSESASMQGSPEVVVTSSGGASSPLDAATARREKSLKVCSSRSAWESAKSRGKGKLMQVVRKVNLGCREHVLVINFMQQLLRIH